MDRLKGKLSKIGGLSGALSSRQGLSANVSRAAVQSVNGKTGVVTLTIDDIMGDDNYYARMMTYNSVYEFPNIGQPLVIYVDSSANRIYRWDDDDKKYYCIGSDWTQVNCINGGNASGRTND